MLYRNFYWINGRAINQLELELPTVTVMDFGFSGTQCEPLIGARLKLLLGEEKV
jgi:hypothetical protein